jgi:D-glycero-D-manno-heptose 1,7-bisphosphate phosphatase
MERTRDVKGADIVKKPAVFMDRDGTINEQMGYINHLSRFIILPGVPEAIRLLNENGFLSIVVSNQSGVARGYFTEDLVERVHESLRSSLRENGSEMDDFFFCPHYPRGSLPEYCFECDCRKPKTGLIDQARRKFDIHMERSYVIGDRHADIEFAHNARLKGILVKTGYGLGEIEHVLPRRSLKPEYIAEDLLDAVKWILKKESTCYEY